MSEVDLKTQEADDAVYVSDDTLNALVGYNIKRISNVFQHDLAHTLKPLELRMITFTVLVMIVDNPGVRQSQLAASLSIERPNCVVIIDELEQRNLIKRTQESTDRRAYGLYVTAAGRALHKRALRAVTAHEKALLAGFNSKQLKQINEATVLLGSLLKNTRHAYDVSGSKA